MDARTLQEKILTVYKATLQSDTWGQIIEATEGYEKIINLLQDIQRLPEISSDQKTLLAKIAAIVRLRWRSLREGGGAGSSSGGPSLTSEDAKRFGEIFEQMLGHGYKLPFSFGQMAIQDDSASGKKKGVQEEAPALGSDYMGTLLPKPTVPAGTTILQLKIDRIGFKDVEAYLDSFLCISVRDAAGNIVGKEQSTPISNRKDERYILFHNDVWIQTPQQQLPRGGAIFVEFKHFKPKKKKTSTKCFSFMEMDELNAAGERALELYKKPTDYKRKKLNLLSVKPLYLHLSVNLFKY